MALIDQVRKVIRLGQEKQWYETYWAFDVHSTILLPNYDLNKKPSNEDFYPYAKELLQLLTEMDHIKLILWTSSYPHEIEDILRLFKRNDIEFDYVGENPEISSDQGNFGYYETKFYFNILFEDKAGFRPEEELEEIYNEIKRWMEGDLQPDPTWNRKY